MSDRKPIRRALLSVYDKAGLVELGKVLSDSGIEILSTGSTAKTLQTAGIQAREVSSYTGFPEIMGGRVKTLHPRIHSGILADQNNSDHLKQIAELILLHSILLASISIHSQQRSHQDPDLAECIEQIDIGSPSMLRGAAKNHGSVAVVCQPTQCNAHYRQLEQADLQAKNGKNWPLSLPYNGGI